VLDVVLGGVRVREVVHDVEPLAVGVVDLDEGLPLIRERVFGEDRLDRALRFACPAVRSVDPAGECESVLAGDDSAERVFLIYLALLDIHHSPIRLACREIEPTNGPSTHPVIRLAARLLPRPDGDVAGEWRNTLEPRECAVFNG